MGEALKSRGLSSASTRRCTLQELGQEPELQRETMTREASELDLLPQSSDEENSDRDDSSTTSSTPSEPELDSMSSVQSPSDCSLRTPDEIPSLVLARIVKSVPNLFGDSTGRKSPLLHSSIHSESESEISRPGTTNVNRPPSPVPILQSSLVTLSDWNYERFSAVLNPDQVQEVLATEDYPESYSPIEVATPILYSHPRTRPSVVSIGSIASKPRSRMSVASGTHSIPQIRKPHPPSPRPGSHVSQPHAFLACEATPPQMLSNPKLPLRSSSATYQELSQRPPNPDAKLERKTSAPMLTVASSFSHLHSTSDEQQKEVVNATAPPIEHARPDSHFASSMKANAYLSPQSSEHVRISMYSTEYTESTMSRPSTGYSQASRNSQPSPENATVPSSKQSALHVARKKSISALRSRSGSIGQALKSVASKGRLSMRPDATIPPMPVLVMPEPEQSPNLNNLLTPRASSRPSTRSSIAGFSLFPAGVGVGLGLRNS